MFRLANTNDLDQIIEITIKNQKIMNEIDKIGQWNNGYPNKDVFTSDIASKQLYVLEDNNIIVGFIVLNKHEYDQYKDIKWNSNEECNVIHRFAVNPDYQQKGYGSMLLQNCFTESINQGINYLKIDTSSKNDKMNGVIKKNGFIFTGQMDLQGCGAPLWNCYDIIL